MFSKHRPARRLTVLHSTLRIKKIGQNLFKLAMMQKTLPGNQKVNSLKGIVRVKKNVTSIQIQKVAIYDSDHKKIN